MFLLSGLGQFLLGQFVVGEDLACRLKLHDSGIEIVFGQQTLALAHGGVEGILFVLALLEDGAHGIGLTANIFVLRKDLQGLFVFGECFLVFLLAIVLVTGIQMGIEHFLTGTVFLDLLHGLGQLLLRGGVVGFLFQCHLIVGFGTDEVLGIVFLIAFPHQRLV